MQSSIDLDQRASSGKVYNSEASKGAEPLQLLGTCAGSVSAAFNTMVMATFLYRCPNTRLRVQGWVADERSLPGKLNYEAMNCLACGGVHLVNPASGKTIDEDDNNLK